MTWRFIDFQRYNAFENMAIDEAIFIETISLKKSPTIRFYGWKPAAVSIGYFQDIQREVNIEECRAAGVDIVRRLSGGKAVLHCSEVTYSVTACTEEKLFSQDILGTYKIISNCIAQGLKYLGIEAVLAESGRILTDNNLKSCCFSTPSKNELLVAGRKICGSAQVRISGGFLQHGSIQQDFNPEQTALFLLPLKTDDGQLQKLRDSITAINSEIGNAVDEEEICANLKRGFRDVLGIRIREDKLTTGEKKIANDLLSKYADAGWNMNGKKERFRKSG